MSVFKAGILALTTLLLLAYFGSRRRTRSRTRTS